LQWFHYYFPFWSLVLSLYSSASCFHSYLSKAPQKWRYCFKPRIGFWMWEKFLKSSTSLVLSFWTMAFKVFDCDLQWDIHTMHMRTNGLYCPHICKNIKERKVVWTRQNNMLFYYLSCIFRIRVCKQNFVQDDCFIKFLRELIGTDTCFLHFSTFY